MEINFNERRLCGVIFFRSEREPRGENGLNEHLNLMRRYRGAGPTYPEDMIDEFAPVS